MSRNEKECCYCKEPIDGIVVPDGINSRFVLSHKKCEDDYYEGFEERHEILEKEREEARALREIELNAIAPKCNLCGEPCCIVGSVEDIKAGLINAQASGGYDSTPGNGQGALDDGTTYTFNLCEFCLDWLFTQFVIPPSLWDYMYNMPDPEAWEPAEKRCQQGNYPEPFRTEAKRRADLRGKK